MTDRLIIRTEAEALAYIAAQVEAGAIEQPTIEDGKALRHRRCNRCSGSGLWSGPWSAGTCFACGGRPERMTWTEWMPLVEFARYLRTKERRYGAKRAQRAAARAQVEAKQREANAKLGLGARSDSEVVQLDRASRAADRAARQQLREHVGTVGEQVKLEVTLVAHKSTVSRYGALEIYRFIDQRGNLVVWMTSKNLGVSLRDRFVLSGEVKKHDEFRREAQTLVSRVELAELGRETIDPATLVVACEFALEQGWASYSFADLAQVQAGTADERTELWVLDHPATRRALAAIAGSAARAA